MSRTFVTYFNCRVRKRLSDYKYYKVKQKSVGADVTDY